MILSCRSSLRQRAPIAPFLYPLQQQQVRGAKNNPQARGKKDTPKKKDKGLRDYRQKSLKDIEQFALCDAMRYPRQS
jgi:large subunit ribosomal protein L1